MKNKSHTSSSPRSPKRRHIFVFLAEPGNTVFLGGCFNNWNSAEKQMIDKTGTGEYRCTMLLAPGIYQYKFYVNDAWRIDPNNHNFSSNSVWTLNSILKIE